MSDFEQRLRATIVERSEGFEPSDDLPDRVAARVRRRRARRARRQMVAGGLVAAAAVVLVVGVITLGGKEQGSVRTSDRDVVVTTPEDTTPRSTTTTGSTTTTTSGSTTSGSTTTTSAPPASPTRPAIDFLTPLNRQGIGPIRAGMTLREAQEAGGVTLLPSAPNSSGTCVEARFEGIDPSPWLIVELAGADVMDGVVRAAQGSVMNTEEGAQVGQLREDLLAALGSPTRTEAASDTFGGDAELLVFESGGYAYGALVSDQLVLGLQSGDPDWVSATEGCPT